MQSPRVVALVHRQFRRAALQLPRPLHHGVPRQAVPCLADELSGSILVFDLRCLGLWTVDERLSGWPAKRSEDYQCGRDHSKGLSRFLITRELNRRDAVRLNMLIAIIPVIALVVGLLLWALASNALTKEIGRIMFAAGLLVTLLVAAHYSIRIGAG